MDDNVQVQMRGFTPENIRFHSADYHYYRWEFPPVPIDPSLPHHAVLSRNLLDLLDRGYELTLLGYDASLVIPDPMTYEIIRSSGDSLRPRALIADIDFQLWVIGTSCLLYGIEIPKVFFDRGAKPILPVKSPFHHWCDTGVRGVSEHYYHGPDLYPAESDEIREAIKTFKEGIEMSKIHSTFGLF